LDRRRSKAAIWGGVLGGPGGLDAIMVQSDGDRAGRRSGALGLQRASGAAFGAEMKE
jgi:hypothetical protein